MVNVFKNLQHFQLLNTRVSSSFQLFTVERARYSETQEIRIVCFCHALPSCYSSGFPPAAGNLNLSCNSFLPGACTYTFLYTLGRLFPGASVLRRVPSGVDYLQDFFKTHCRADFFSSLSFFFFLFRMYINCERKWAMNKQGKKVRAHLDAKIHGIYHCSVYTKQALNKRFRYLLPRATISVHVTRISEHFIIENIGSKGKRNLSLYNLQLYSKGKQQCI